VNGHGFSGVGAWFEGIVSDGPMTWTSDFSHTNSGWKLCPDCNASAAQVSRDIANSEQTLRDQMSDTKESLGDDINADAYTLRDQLADQGRQTRRNIRSRIGELASQSSEEVAGVRRNISAAIQTLAHREEEQHLTLSSALGALRFQSSEQTAAVQEDVRSAVQAVTQQGVKVGSDLEKNVSAAVQVISNQDAGVKDALSSAAAMLSHQSAAETAKVQHTINSGIEALAHESADGRAEMWQKINQSVEALAQQESKHTRESVAAATALAHQSAQGIVNVEQNVSLEAGLLSKQLVAIELQMNARMHDEIGMLAYQDAEEAAHSQHGLERLAHERTHASSQFLWLLVLTSCVSGAALLLLAAHALRRNSASLNASEPLLKEWQQGVVSATEMHRSLARAEAGEFHKTELAPESTGERQQQLEARMVYLEQELAGLREAPMLSAKIVAAEPKVSVKNVVTDTNEIVRHIDIACPGVGIDAISIQRLPNGARVHIKGGGAGGGDFEKEFQPDYQLEGHFELREDEYSYENGVLHLVLRCLPPQWMKLGQPPVSTILMPGGPSSGSVAGDARSPEIYSMTMAARSEDCCSASATSSWLVHGVAMPGASSGEPAAEAMPTNAVGPCGGHAESGEQFSESMSGPLSSPSMKVVEG